ncbi:hypothetical protein M0208_03010 [Sphingomonas sp. SUN019]|uniref:hypothetical protein n=1 Tax=Sphingomonas sp. SUN019 TaxID=2937788 RepID=UPI0021648422|nr:hypothetical protein [Sphingomonas sp. SUN019]UVO49530.1 hypothetical protein M0208_03010 [Sphingomonas sp. SUN019]
MASMVRWLLAGVACALIVPHAVAQTKTPELAYQLTEGDNINAFVREADVAAHLLLRSGVDPRVLVAFPAGNSGVGLWFDTLGKPARWTLDAAPQPIALTDKKGRALNGIRATATIDAPRLVVKQGLLSNVRFLRDYQAVGRFPPELATAMTVAGDRISYARDRVDGAPGYLLTIRVVEGKIERDAIVAGPGGRIRVEITAATGDTPLHGLALSDLLNDRAADDPVARNALRFLSYREKFLAGSWRFNTYFGRDTLMSVRLLMPALQPPAIEAGLNSVLARLNAAGEVAHEEAPSEFAVLERRKNGETGDAATLDYAMVDDDFMLAPVAATYLLDHASKARGAAWLARAVPSEVTPGNNETAGKALIRNLRFVIAQAQPFAAKPGYATLIEVKKGRMAGQWRDSDEGIGRGRYAYDVNAVFVPAALDAARRMRASGLLDAYLSPADRAALDTADKLAATWRARVPAMFKIAVPAATAAPQIRAYAESLNVPAAPALAALGKRPLAFHAIALDAAGRAVPIIHSDEGFALLFGDPPAADLDTYVETIMRPFPAGLMTGIGLLVANPALADTTVEARFSPAHYHGAVVWSWQQAVLAAGLERQLARTDLPAATRTRLTDAQAALWRVIAAAREVQSSELWSWAYRDGRYRVVPFGAGKKDVDESNAAQLWSTVYLAVQPPKGGAR